MKHPQFGALAQLVERNNGIVEVNGSTPLRSISSTPQTRIALFGVIESDKSTS